MDISDRIVLLDFNFYLPTPLHMVSTKKNTTALYISEKLMLQGCSSQFSEIWEALDKGAFL